MSDEIVLVECRQGHKVAIASVLDIGDGRTVIRVLYKDMNLRETYNNGDAIGPISSVSPAADLDDQPPSIKLWCQRHGEFEIYKSDLWTEVWRARQLGRTVHIRARKRA